MGAFGTVRRLPSGRWQARYPRHGERVTAPHPFPTKSAALRWLREVEVDLARGVYVDHRSAMRTSVREWAGLWLTVHRTLTPKTRASYVSLLDTCVLSRVVDGREIGLGDDPVGSLRPMRVKEWQAELERAGLSASRRRQALGLLSQMCDAAVLDGLLPSNPCAHVTRPAVKPGEPRILTPDEVARLAERADPVTGLMVEVMAYCGLRVGELLALRRRHLAGRVLLVEESVGEVSGRQVAGDTKAHQKRSVPMPSSLAAHLSEHARDLLPDAWLFTGRTGRPLGYATLRRRFDRAVLAAGLGDVTPHDLRATCGSWVAASHGVLEAARRLGHSKESVTTRHYARPLLGGDDQVADALDVVRRAAKGGQ